MTPDNMDISHSREETINDAVLDDFWKNLKQQQHLLKKSWNEYFEAVKSLEKEKEEVHKMKSGVLGTVRELREEMMRVSEQLLDVNCNKLKGSRKNLSKKKVDLSELKSMQSTLKTLAPKEGTTFVTERNFPGDTAVEAEKSTNNQSSESYKMDHSGNGNSSGELPRVEGIQSTSKELRNAIYIQTFARNEAELEMLDKVCKTELGQLSDKITAALQVTKIFQSQKTIERELEPEIRSLKEHTLDLIFSRIDLLSEMMELTREKYKIKKEKIMLIYQTSNIEDTDMLARAKVKLASVPNDCALKPK